MDNLFLSAGFESSAESVLSTGNGKRVRGREANVYDAVAGRVTINSALADAENPRYRTGRRHSALADRYFSSRNPRLAPDHVLFRRRHAPPRYHEYDIYWAHEDLPHYGQGLLPESNLLRSIHAYTSRFYEATAARLGPSCFVGRRTIDERSMDETALLAFGILLEEAACEVLGKRGDLVFTEPVTNEKQPQDGGAAAGHRVPQRSAIGEESGVEIMPEGTKRAKKRRKVEQEDSET